MSIPAEKETHSMTDSSPTLHVRKNLISPVFAMEKLTSSVLEVPVKMMVPAMWITMSTAQISNFSIMEKLYQKMPVKVKKTFLSYDTVE